MCNFLNPWSSSAEASMELSITDVWSFFKLLDSDLEAEISPELCQSRWGIADSSCLLLCKRPV